VLKDVNQCGVSGISSKGEARKMHWELQRELF